MNFLRLLIQFLIFSQIQNLSSNFISETNYNPNDEIQKAFLTDNGFNSLFAIIGKSGQGIGTNALRWA